mgnify:FL=1|jgi:hypothetical protein|tara:strand:- start:1512 stop:2150 length:639 start_codon:yes stop_codon:yes gene_type:complete
MAFTFTTLKQAIQDYLETNETTLVTNLPTIITQAEERILKSVQLPNFRKNVTGTTTQSNNYLETPTDFLSPYSLAVDNSGYEYLLFKDVNFIRQAYPVAATTGVPKHYALFDDTTFILGPTPNANFTVELHYFYEPESITVASSGTSWLGSNAENALLYGCLIEAYTYIKGEPDLMQLYQVRYESAMQELIALGEGYSTTDSYRAGSVRSDR